MCSGEPRDRHVRHSHWFEFAVESEGFADGAGNFGTFSRHSTQASLRSSRSAHARGRQRQTSKSDPSSNSIISWRQPHRLHGIVKAWRSVFLRNGAKWPNWSPTHARYSVGTAM